MKRKKLLSILFLFQLNWGLSQSLPITSCQEDTSVTMNAMYSRAAAVDAALHKLTQLGVPGVSMAVYSKEGWWSTSHGYAKLEGQVPMQGCHLQYLQSISKTYMAVAILKLAEQGKIDLDQQMTVYLPKPISQHITQAEKISVRMLLNHTSGIPEYNMQPAYVSYLLQHPKHIFEPEDYLGYIHQKPLDFPPGSKYSYRNTNYLLLTMIADFITGDHTKLIRESIFQPLQLTHTFYRGDADYLNYPTLVNTYWDRHSNGILENASLLQRNNVASLVGDDGIVTTPPEAVKFLKGLVEGKLLSAQSLEQMRTWVTRKEKPVYGLGLVYGTFAGNIGYGHSGGGIGAGCQLYYFPEKEVYVFVAINLGTVTDSPIHKKAESVIEEFYAALLN